MYIEIINLKRMYQIITWIALIGLLASCQSKDFKLKEVNFLSNYSAKMNDSTLAIEADLTDAVLNGIVVPSVRQTKEGNFQVSFTLENNSGQAKHLWYKLYYQNESYKLDGSLADENFYGSWEDTGYEFKATPEFKNQVTIKDSFRIVGNPRNESIYFGKDLNKCYVTMQGITDVINYINETPEWKKEIEKNAVINKIPVEDQMFCDAVWSINNKRLLDTTNNNRWKRNPRMGNYRFMLVVTTDNDLMKMPISVRNISRKESNNTFVNPFEYFASHKRRLKNTLISTSGLVLNVKSVFKPENGIYMNRLKTTRQNINKSYYNESCNDSVNLYASAQFEQYFHPINKSIYLKNIKEVSDVSGGEYPKRLYEDNKTKYNVSKDFTNQYMSITDCPCKTVSADKVKKTITILNPGNTSGELKKEQVGIGSRIGFTYGKWRAKIRFPKLINTDNVWNGLTAAYWLIYQDDAKWNYRRTCESPNIKYIPKNLPDNEEAAWKSTDQTHYSEIDFEIVKESAFWTSVMYKKNKAPTDDPYNTNDITVTCTNWDLACHQPKKFLVGAKDVTIEGKTYHFGRWSDYYKAVTAKIQVNHNDLMGQDYYYEIDWQPTRIIWRIGKTKNEMREICRMDDNFTSIPNNQMTMMLTQEFHYQDWWPTSPFKQNFIPFPKKDLVGTLLELEVE
jgi:hypothetical protein